MIRGALALAAALTLAGCAGGGADGGDARADLEDSLAGLQAGNYTFTRSIGTTVRGFVALPGGSQIEQQHGPSVTRAGDALYLRYRIHGGAYDTYAKLYDQHGAKKEKQVLAVLDGTRWARADEKRLTAAADADDLSGLEDMPPKPTAAAPDVTGAGALVDAVVSAKRTGDTVTGTLDATKVDPELGLFLNDPYYFYGPAASAMRYEATLDDQGRLTRLQVDVPGQLQEAASAPPEAFPSGAPTEPAGPPLVVTVSGYGSTPVPAAPSGAVDLDPAAYDMLTRDVD